MLFRPVLFLFLVLFIASCGNKKEAALKLSTDINNINDSLAIFGKTWGDEFAIGTKTGSFIYLEPIRMEMQGYIDRKIEYIASINDVNGSEELRKTQLQFLEFEKKLVQEKFSVFEGYNDSTTTQEQVLASYNDMNTLGQQEQQMLERIKNLQYDFAEKNGFPKPLEK
jgi:hypothetical protein